MSFEIIARSCDGGDCPTFRRDPATGTVRVTGYNPDDPTTERDVDIPAAAWDRLVRELLA